MSNFGFFSDSALTTALTTKTINQNVNGNTGDVDFIAYFGSTNSAIKVQANSNPGVDQITASISDASPGSGVESSHIKLALTSGGLAGATPGASLNLGTQVLGGIGNAKTVYVRVADAVLAEGQYTDISIALNNIIEVAA